jgi:hypothetical protein
MQPSGGHSEARMYWGEIIRFAVAAGHLALAAALAFVITEAIKYLVALL